MIQGEFDEVSTDYKEFVDKFMPKKTTDDCYTPRISLELSTREREMQKFLARGSI